MRTAWPGSRRRTCELARPLGRLPALERGVDDAPAGAGAKPRERDVVGHGEGQGEALALAVLAEVAEAVGEAPRRRGVEGALAAPDADAPRRRAGEAEEGPHHLGPARAHEAEDAEDLAAAEGERGLVKPGRGEAAHLERDRVGGAARRVGETARPTVRPTMRAMSSSLVTDASVPVPTVRPSRSTVKAEATARVSSRKWLM